MDFELKKSGRIPAFGNWENAIEMPITQYFESAREAGLVRYSASSGGDYDNKCHINNSVHYGCGGGGCGFYSAVDYGGMPPPRGVYAPAPPPRKVRTLNRRHQEVKGRKMMLMKVRDVMNVENHYQTQQQKPRTKSQQQFTKNEKNSMNLGNHVEEQGPANTVSKPVDEDLYKIPPDLLHKSERKRRLGFFSRCLVPPCSA